MTVTEPSLAASGLETGDLTIRYGGHVAVDKVNLTAPLGRITGLIGPNGAGKTTIFNGCNGIVRPSSGTVHLFGHNVTFRSPAARARLGLGRTFQRMELCNAMTVRTNVTLGLEAGLIGQNPVRLVLTRPGRRRVVQEATEDALVACGIADIASRVAGTLSTGQRRLVELARALAGRFRLLLLDEPSSGLDEEETARFGHILTGVVRERGIGILLVEHDIELVMAVCDYLYVLDFGHLIFEGTPSEARSSDIVRAAYLGQEKGNDD